jgi:CheY-like chemotaxis protein
MLHELGTNAIKYGALSTAKGMVTIGWSVADAMLRLRWEERGGPVVHAPARRGFGRTLIEQSAKGEGGDALMSIEAEGVVWNITLPLGEHQPMKSSAAEFVSAAAHGVATSVGKDMPRLAGKRVLVVEDEPLVALDIVAELEGAGADVVGSAGTAKEALHIIDNTLLDAALLDANLRGHPVGEIAAALAARNVPFLFVTGYGAGKLAAGLRQDCCAFQALQPRAIDCGRDVARGSTRYRTSSEKVMTFRLLAHSAQSVCDGMSVAGES